MTKFSQDYIESKIKVSEYGIIENGYDDLVFLYGEIVSKLELGFYQGDLLYIVQHPITKLYGYITTGFGSCSGCDALQSISFYADKDKSPSWNELIKLVDGLDPITWYTATELLTWLETHDWEGDYLSYSAEEISDWVHNVVTPLIKDK